MSTAFDAIVIGAGPAGCGAAILLAEAGWRVALVEKQVYPRRKVCGECISATNLPILEALGIGPQLSRFGGHPLRHVALVSGAHIVRAPLPAYEDGAHPWGLALAREHLDTLLLEQAARRGVSVFQPWQVYAIDGVAGNHACRLRHTNRREECELPAALVVDAHGSWEPPVAGSGGATAGAAHGPSDLFGFKANFRHASLEHDLLPVLAFPGGYGGMVVAGEATATFACCLRRDALARARARFPGVKAAEAAFAWVREHAPATERLLGEAVQCGGWLAAGPIRPGVRVSSRDDTVFRIGNAAGEAHPIIGEGIGMALQSAVLLAEILVRRQAHRAGAPSHQGARSEYAASWRRRFGRRIRMSALYAHLAMRPQVFGAVLPALGRHPALLTGFARWCGKVRPRSRVQGKEGNRNGMSREPI